MTYYVPLITLKCSEGIEYICTLIQKEMFWPNEKLNDLKSNIACI